jgi:hypothetical protein
LDDIVDEEAFVDVAEAEFQLPGAVPVSVGPLPFITRPSKIQIQFILDPNVYITVVL